MSSDAKRKRLCTYNREWEDTYSWLTKKDGDDERGYCRICARAFTISHGGQGCSKIIVRMILSIYLFLCI